MSSSVLESKGWTSKITRLVNMTRQMSELISLSFLIMSLPSTRGSGTFEATLVRVENDQGKLANGDYCRGGVPESSNDSSSGPGICETVFEICLLPYRDENGASIIGDEPNCSYGEAVSDHMGINTLNLERDRKSVVAIPFTFTWPGSTTVVIRLIHHRHFDGKRQLIKEVVRSIRLTASNDWLSLDSNSTVDESSTWFRIQLQIHCDADYYGPFCNVSCKAEDGLFGHYECNVDGSRRCLEGWRNLATRCTEPICAMGCQGSCDRPGECSKCPYGWTGPNCTQCVRYPGCIHGDCKQPFECLCHPRWGGHQCDLDMDYCHHKSPCKNGATCEPSAPNNYTCVCPPGFVGRDCEIEQNPCASNPCLNFGTCVVKSKFDYQCVCSRFHTGDRCERLLAGRGDMDPCLVGEQYYEHGQSWDMPGCRRCQCFDGSANCTKMLCQTGDCVSPENPCPDGYRCSPTVPDVHSCMRHPCSGRSYGMCLPYDFDESMVPSQRIQCDHLSTNCSRLILNVNTSLLPIGTYAANVCYHIMVHIFERRFSQYHMDCSADPNSASTIVVQIVSLREQWPASDFGNVLRTAFNEHREVFTSPLLRSITSIGDDIASVGDNDVRQTNWTEYGGHVVIASIMAVCSIVILLSVATCILYRRMRSPILKKPAPDAEKAQASPTEDFKLNNWADQRKQCNIWAAAACGNKALIRKEINIDAKQRPWPGFKESKQCTEVVLDSKGHSATHCQGGSDKSNGFDASKSDSKGVSVRLKLPVVSLEASV